MRDIVKRAVSQFLAGELPSDEDYYKQKNQEVARLVEALEQLTGRSISWEPRVDMFNFYHLQIPVDFKLDVPLYEITIDQLEELVLQGRATSFLHLLISTFTPWICTYWSRYFPPELEETVSSEVSFEDSAEEQLFEQVRQKIEEHGWLWLPPAEAVEPIPEAPPPWPYQEGPALVQHILFPGCGPLIDLYTPPLQTRLP